ncbi:MAG TPA: hypothetical protein VG713_05450 [Pirellulales bacterium]|nr:hypothetical protein [Pirellulales bacterium]
MLWRGIVNHAEFNIETMPELVDTGQEPETSICLKAIDEVFGVHAIDDATGAGLTAWERLDLLASLSDYLEALKKNIGAMPTLPALTDSKFFRSSDQQGAAATDTSGSLDSGSMLSEPKPDSPTALSEESSPESAAS